MDILLQPTSRIFKKLFILCLLSAALSHNSPSFAIAGYRVIRVVDGDTIVVDYEGRVEKVRMLCVDTPESVHPDKKQNVPMGEVASHFAEEQLSGKYVGLEFEEHRLRGNYGRLLAYVIVDRVNFNLELVRRGMSPYYTKYGYSARYDEQFRALEKQARKEKLGIWGDPELTRKYLRLKSKWGQTASRLK
jgi:micrococcal nuclease